MIIFTENITGKGTKVNLLEGRFTQIKFLLRGEKARRNLWDVQIFFAEFSVKKTNV